MLPYFYGIKHPDFSGCFLLMVFRASADFHALFLPRPYCVAIREVDHQHFCSLNSYELPDGCILIPKNILGDYLTSYSSLRSFPSIAWGVVVGECFRTTCRKFFFNRLHLYPASPIFSRIKRFAHLLPQRHKWALREWCRVQGSNLRPSACKADALPAELTRHI